MYTTDTISRFTHIVGIDFSTLLSDFVDFNDNYKQNIIDYYGGRISIPDSQSFDKLSDLQYRYNRAINGVMLNKRQFQYFEDWELLEELDQVKTKLQTISNSSKFLRSSIEKNNFNPNPLIEITLQQNQTLERLAKDLNAQDYQNDWTKVFLDNQLIEEDYTSQGGILLKVTFQGADSLYLSSVVDNINTDEKTYGIDIYKTLTFENDDLKVLTYKETLLQSITILSQLRKSDNPEFPDDGLDPSLVIGSTLGAVAFPSLFRQMYNTFATDDSLKSFSLTNVSINGDKVQLDYQITTRVGEIQQGSVSI